MAYFIAGAVLLTGAYQAKEAKKARKSAEAQQTQALAQQQKDSELMRLDVQKQTEAYRQQGASLQDQAQTARQSFDAQKLQFAENKLAMEQKAKEIQAESDAERRKAATAEASALKARTRGGRRSLLSQQRMDAELGVPMSLGGGSGTLQ